MPNTRLLPNGSGYESTDDPDSVTNPNPQEVAGNTEVVGTEDSVEEAAPGPKQGSPQDFKPRPGEVKGENVQKMGYENVQPMMPMQPHFMPQMNHPVNMPQNPHGVVNHPGMPMPPMNHPPPGFPMMGFPVFQPNMNMNEFAFVPPIRFPSKDLGSVDHISPQAVLGRLSTPPVPPQTFGSHQSAFYAPASNYTQYFDNKDDPDLDLAFLDYSGGVVFDNGPFANGGRWLTFWEYKGRIWRKAFPVTLFGTEGAKELAENFWVSKMRAIQLFNRNKQERLMKMDQKKPDSRGRKKKPGSSEAQIPHLSLDPTLAAQYILQDHVNKETMEALEAKYKKEPVDEELDIPIPTPKVREPRAPQPEFEGLTWDQDNSCWSFDKIENDELTTFRLPCENREDGLKEIQAMKDEYENALLKEYEAMDTKGVTYEKTRMIWKVSYWIQSKGIRRYKMFSVTKLGYKEAKDAAVAFKQAVDELGGEEPEDMTPEPLSPEELFADPIVDHYHKVLSSIAAKGVKDVLS